MLSSHPSGAVPTEGLLLRGLHMMGRTWLCGVRPGRCCVARIERTTGGYTGQVGGTVGRARPEHRGVPASSTVRTVLIVDGYESLLRARRRAGRGWEEEAVEAYRRHRWRVEGVHGEAKTGHGLRRAVRWGLANVAIQVYLTAAVMNLKPRRIGAGSPFSVCSGAGGGLGGAPTAQSSPPPGPWHVLTA